MPHGWSRRRSRTTEACSRSFDVTEWFAIALGLAFGAYASYLVGNRVLPRLVERTRNPT